MAHSRSFPLPLQKLEKHLDFFGRFAQVDLSLMAAKMTQTSGRGRKDPTRLFSTNQKMEFLPLMDLSQLTEIMDAIILPLIGGIALLIAKFSQGESRRWAERQFFIVLVAITLVTLRTVIKCDEFWLVHTTTLGTMIVGSLVIPSLDASIAV
jgi:membrane protein CcdC involved in cytochrome C biogenesis